MNDPFGDDDVDFEVEKMLQGSYKNAVALLADTRQPLGTISGGVGNPLREKLQFMGSGKSSNSRRLSSKVTPSPTPTPSPTVHPNSSPRPEP